MTDNTDVDTEVDTEVVEQEHSGMRESLLAAIKEKEGVEEEAEEVEARPQAKEPEAPAPEPQEESPAEATDRTADNRIDEKIERAPAGWKPAERVGWDQIPESTRRKIHIREAEIAKNLQQSAADRNLAGQFNATIEPYRAVMAAEGVDNPLEAVGGLLKTAAALKMGSQEQKAQRVAQLITHYGVDLETLDTVLSGQISGEPQQASPRDTRLENLEKFAQTMQGRLQEAEQQTLSQVGAEIQNFSKGAEFFEDVREEMADLMDLAKNKGRSMTLQQAYDTAVRMNPEISALMARRGTEQATAAQNQAVDSKIAAAKVSRPPSTAGNGATQHIPGKSIRADIENAIKSLDS